LSVWAGWFRKAHRGSLKTDRGRRPQSQKEEDTRGTFKGSESFKDMRTKGGVQGTRIIQKKKVVDRTDRKRWYSRLAQFDPNHRGEMKRGVMGYLLFIKS